MSGIQATDEARETYQKLSRSKIQYVVFKIDKIDGTEVIALDCVGEKVKEAEQDACWEDFCSKLPETEGRYGVFDFRWTQSDGRKQPRTHHPAEEFLHHHQTLRASHHALAQPSRP